MGGPTYTDFSAGDSLIGYVYQCEYALYRLLDRDNPPDQVSIETADDVVLGDPDDPEAVLQLKHHTKSIPTLTDKSEDLWKTLRVWCSMIRAGHLNPSTTAFLLLSTAPAPTDKKAVANLLSPALAMRDEKGALEVLRGLAGETLQDPQINVKGSRYKGASAFAALSDGQQRALVGKIQILTEQPPLSQLRQKIIERLRLSGSTSEMLPAFVESVVGWWYWVAAAAVQTDDHTKRVISREALELKLAETASALAVNKLQEFNDLLDPQASDLAALSDRIFVRQLASVGLNRKNTLVASAMVDFYKADGHVKRWIEQLRVSPEELRDYHAELHGTWSVEFGGAELDVEACQTADNPDLEMRKVGARTLTKTLQTHGPGLKGFSGTYLRRGSFHELANQPSIGWHPQWAQLFSPDK